MSVRRYKWILLLAAAIVAFALVACGQEAEPREVRVVETVVIEKEVTRTEKIVETVVVERTIAGETVKVVETVVVEREVPGETIVETVVVEKAVDRPVVQTVVVTTEKVVVESAPVEFYGEVVANNTDTPAAKFTNQVPLHYLMHYYGFTEPLMRANHSPPPNYSRVPSGNGIAESWVVASDGSKITFKIREGVEFHDGWGPLTAHDVGFNFDECWREGITCASRAGAEQFVDSWEVVDDRTFVINVKESGLIPEWWDGVMGNTAYQAIQMFSKKLFDDLGYDTAVDIPIGTGPFKVVEWVTDSKIVLEPAFDQHWRRTPNIARVTVREIQEASVLIAALKTGEVDIGKVPLKFINSTLRDIPGARTQGLGVPNNQTFIFAGNYWSTTEPGTGAAEDNHGPINARIGFLPDDDHPWIGDPSDPASMERARKVREAMSIAIDRTTIVDKIQSGIGRPYFSNMNSHPGDEAWQESWKIPYEPERAKQLLAEAGYADGFSFITHVAPDREWEPEVGAAVAQYWRELGLDVQVDNTTYITARPLLVERKKDNPWMIHTGTGQTLDTAGIFACCFKPTGGFNFGIELPDEIWMMAEANNDIVNTTREERIARNIEIQNFFSDNWLTAPIAQLPNTYVVRPEIAEWTPYMAQTPEFNSPETIRVNR